MNRIAEANAATSAELLLQEDDFVLTGHLHGDGDSIGSLLALGQGLLAAGKKRVRLRADAVSPLYAFLPGVQLIETWQEGEAAPAVFVALDCATPERLSGGKDCFAGAAITLNIDHHPGNTCFARYNWVEPTAAAVGEQVFLVLQAMGVKLDRDMATCLYTALATDSGSFRYDSVTPRTHRIAAELLSCGAAAAAVNVALFETRSLEQTKLLALALGTLTVSPGGKVAWLSATRDMFAVAGSDDIETESLISFARAISGVEVAILFREQADGTVRVGLRARHHVDVNSLARQFGGGGHRKAAGCTLPGTIPVIRNQVVSAARRAAND